MAVVRWEYKIVENIQQHISQFLATVRITAIFLVNEAKQLFHAQVQCFGVFEFHLIIIVWERKLRIGHQQW